MLVQLVHIQKKIEDINIINLFFTCTICTHLGEIGNVQVVQAHFGEIGKYSKEIFLTIFLAKPYFSVQIVQGENRLKRLIFSEFFVDVQVVQAHLGEIGKYSDKIYFQHQLCRICIVGEDPNSLYKLYKKKHRQKSTNFF